MDRDGKNTGSEWGVDEERKWRGEEETGREGRGWNDDDDDDDHDDDDDDDDDEFVDL